jgi:5-methylcytosine-specific restriction endonuclease McrA
MSDEPLSFFPLTAKDERALSYVYEWTRRKAEEWYVKTRRELGDARLALDIVVLKPICQDCCGRFGRESWEDRALSGGGKAELVILLPEDVVPERLRFYDGAARCVHLWPPVEPHREPHHVRCSFCGQHVSCTTGDDIINVYEEPFLEYFGFLGEDEEGPRRKRGREERSRIRQMYGSRCFGCGVQLDKTNFTLDHIIAQSRGGPTISINLQPLCEMCNQKKADLPATTVKVALDMLLRPAPWDSYEEPIW